MVNSGDGFTKSERVLCSVHVNSIGTIRRWKCIVFHQMYVNNWH